MRNSLSSGVKNMPNEQKQSVKLRWQKPETWQKIQGIIQEPHLTVLQNTSKKLTMTKKPEKSLPPLLFWTLMKKKSEGRKHWMVTICS